MDRDQYHIEEEGPLERLPNGELILPRIIIRHQMEEPQSPIDGKYRTHRIVIAANVSDHLEREQGEQIEPEPEPFGSVLLRDTPEILHQNPGLLIDVGAVEAYDDLRKEHQIDEVEVVIADILPGDDHQRQHR